jgi:hypothetical protein
MSGCWPISILVEVEMLTTAGILRSSMGAKDGMGWLSVKAGKPMAMPNGLKNSKIGTILNNFNCLTNFNDVIAIPRIINVADRQYRYKNV